MIILLFPAPFYGQNPPGAVSSNAFAPNETGIRRFEVGGQATDLNLGDCNIFSHCEVPQMAVGSRVAFNVNRYLAIDAALNVLTTFDSTHYNFDRGVPAGGRGLEFLAGVKGEVRARRYGFFAEAAPGVLSWSQVLTAYKAGVSTYGRDNLFALKLGGGAEYSPSSRVHLRFDVADMLVKYNQPYWGFGGGHCPWLNNLQTTSGVYVGLGKRMDWQVPEWRAESPHRFFDRGNLTVIGVSLLGQAADAITTQRFIARGQPEEDPLAQPFVKYGWSGQIGLAVLTNSGEIAGMYWLHRMHHHRIERLLPLPYAIASGVMAYRNDKRSGAPAP
jgi:hypothetical protein